MNSQENKIEDKPGIIYILVGVVVFGWLTFTMFKNNFDYIKMDAAAQCTKEGGEWRAYSQECIKEKAPAEAEASKTH